MCEFQSPCERRVSEISAARPLAGGWEPLSGPVLDPLRPWPHGYQLASPPSAAHAAAASSFLLFVDPRRGRFHRGGGRRNAARGRGPADSDGSYGWPIRPFGQAAPRGAAASPTRAPSFAGPPTPAGLNGPGELSSTTWAWTSRPPRTWPLLTPSAPVLPHIRSARDRHGQVKPGPQTSEYWHIVPSVREGQRVTAFETCAGSLSGPASTSTCT